MPAHLRDNAGGRRFAQGELVPPYPNVGSAWRRSSCVGSAARRAVGRGESVPRSPRGRRSGCRAGCGPPTGRSGGARSRTASPARRACWPSGPRAARPNSGGSRWEQAFPAVSVAGDRARDHVRHARRRVRASPWTPPRASRSGRPAAETSSSTIPTATVPGPRPPSTRDASTRWAARATWLCLEAATGKTVWTLDLLKKFGGKVPEYGFSASPAVFGKLLVVDVGAGRAARWPRLDKTTGEVLWTSLADKPGYATPIRAEVGGVPQIIVLMGEALVSVSPEDGREFWRRPWKTEQDANVATPIFHQRPPVRLHRLRHRLRPAGAFRRPRANRRPRRSGPASRCRTTSPPACWSTAISTASTTRFSPAWTSRRAMSNGSSAASTAAR